MLTFGGAVYGTRVGVMRMGLISGSARVRAGAHSGSRGSAAHHGDGSLRTLSPPRVFKGEDGSAMGLLPLP